jgi:hypothetical protein
MEQLASVAGHLGGLRSIASGVSQSYCLGSSSISRRGDVSSTPAKAAALASEDDPSTSHPKERPKANRPKKKNPKYYGDEWAS